MLKKLNVKIWDNSLTCQVCDNEVWYPSILRVEIAEFTGLNYEEQARYMFECAKCENVTIFGMINDWEKHEKNIKVSYTENIE